MRAGLVVFTNPITKDPKEWLFFMLIAFITLVENIIILVSLGSVISMIGGRLIMWRSKKMMEKIAQQRRAKCASD